MSPSPTNQTPITGREPRLSTSYRQKGKRLLSPRRLATMLNVLPPSAISLDAAAEMLRHNEWHVRFNAAKMLSKRGDRDARILMQNMLTAGDSPSRATVARHLYGFSWFAAKALIQQALEDEDPRAREGAIYALCDMRQLNAFQLMVEVLQNEVDSVREAATWGLRDCQDPAAVPVLATALRAQSPEVRVKALEALGANDTPEARPVVREAMNDPDPHVKYAATLSLLELAGEAWLAELAEVIGRFRGVHRQQVLRGFFHATNYLKIDIAQSQAADALIDALEAALLDDLPSARLAAIWPLAWMRHERTPDILKHAYKTEPDSKVKAQIVRVTLSLMSQAGDEILAEALDSDDEHVQRTAREIARRRESGALLAYDEAAGHGIAMNKPNIVPNSKSGNRH